MLSKLLHIALFLITLYSCKRNSDNSCVINSDSDAREFIEKESEKNTYKKRIKEVDFKLKYISNEQMALEDMKGLSEVTQAGFDSIIKNYDSLLFFNLEVTIDNFNEEMLKYKLGENPEASYNDRIDYYSFRMQKDINLVLSEKDTVPCILYHYERNYGVSPKNNFMIGFKTSKIRNAVLVYDNKFLNTGTVKFALNEQEILNHPKIKIN